jgi:hypothetical protein
MESKEKIEKELDKLKNGKEAKADMGRLNAIQLMEVVKITRNIYNEACYDCKEKLFKKEISRYSELCERCRRDFEMKRQFGLMQQLYQKVKT